MTVTKSIRGKKYVWDKHLPHIWKTESGRIVESKNILKKLNNNEPKTNMKNENKNQTDLYREWFAANLSDRVIPSDARRERYRKELGLLKSEAKKIARELA